VGKRNILAFKFYRVVYLYKGEGEGEGDVEGKGREMKDLREGKSKE
jgi:hypothetical protein